MIAIFDYGAGNLRSVQNTLAEIGAEYELVRDAEGLRRATKIILPGVGHFGQMMRALDADAGARGTARPHRAGVPFLGICLGLQALFETAKKRPMSAASGFSPGESAAFPPARAFRIWDGTRSRRAAGSRCFEDLGRILTSTSRTATTRR